MEFALTFQCKVLTPHFTACFPKTEDTKQPQKQAFREN